MAQAEQPERLGPQYRVSVDDVRQLMGASTPHFALQIRNRIRTLISGLPDDHPARLEGERRQLAADAFLEPHERRPADLLPDSPGVGDRPPRVGPHGR